MEETGNGLLMADVMFNLAKYSERKKVLNKGRRKEKK